MGNYLNHGKRAGNAQGFMVKSLSALASVRSALKADRNLTHFVVEHIDDKQPDLLRVKRELGCVFDATKFT